MNLSKAIRLLTKETLSCLRRTRSSGCKILRRKPVVAVKQLDLFVVRPEQLEKLFRNLKVDYPVACFTLSAYEVFETSFESWHDSGILATTMRLDRVIRISKKPLLTIIADSKTSYRYATSIWRLSRIWLNLKNTVSMKAMPSWWRKGVLPRNISTRRPTPHGGSSPRSYVMRAQARNTRGNANIDSFLCLKSSIPLMSSRAESLFIFFSTLTMLSHILLLLHTIGSE